MKVKLEIKNPRKYIAAANSDGESYRIRSISIR